MKNKILYRYFNLKDIYNFIHFYRFFKSQGFLLIIIIIKSLFISIGIEVCATYFLWLNWVTALLSYKIIFKKIMNRQWTLGWWIWSNKSCSITNLLLTTPCNWKHKLLSLRLLSAIITTFIRWLANLISSDLNKIGLIVRNSLVDSLRYLLGLGCR